METPTKSLASRLSQYAYSPTASPSRRSTRSVSAMVAPSPRRTASASASPATPRRTKRPRRRDPSPEVIEISDSSDESDSDSDPEPRRRIRQRQRRPAAAPSASPRKKPRPYADPSTYAHLSGLPQILRPALDLVFCGINPGKKSATDGHHFAHPTNKFWKALHGCGMTERLLTPAEDVTLPAEYNFGMTNLIGRPTIEQSELSPLEMRLAVAPFSRRVASHAPRVLCFVGKGMWDTFAGVVGKTAFVADERDDALRDPANGDDEEVDELEDDVKDEGAPDGAEAEEDELDEDVKPDVDEEEAAVVNAPRPREPLFLPRDETPMVVTYTLSNGTVKREHPDDEDEAKPTAEELEGDAGDAGAEPDEDEPESKPTAEELEEMAINDAPSPLTEVGSPTPPPPPNPASARRRAPAAKAPPFSYDGPQRFRLPVDAADWKYTYFWVVPNTSGLERTPLAEQIVLFGKLRAFVELLKAGGRPEPPAGGFLDIDLAGVGATVAAMRDDAIAKGKMAPE
ncbi:G/U mismatch-specific DNA glycosylase [Vanrija pseudolonga]|uniref:G/U mismatch-specific DNA glycosylase n=1 Tax=Vanrija pseudolonga TaxID=143232 RepID=A0AAF1BLA8_9TREE|nr:G/U mismatch-specific DNA glycosylase [Vanrija pseudolonga]